MKYTTIKIILLLCLLVNCKHNNPNDTKASSTQLNSVISINKEEVGFLTKFYTKYYGEYRDRKGIENYVSHRILNRIDSLTTGDNLILDYDPFIKGQDWDVNVLVNSLKIEPLKNKNEYRVSFLLFGNKEEQRTNIDLLLNVNNKGKLLIYSILNDEYLNFRTEKTIKPEGKPLHYEKNKINIKGLWSLHCGGDLTIFDISENKGYLSLYSFNKIYINTILKETSLSNEYDLYFDNSEFKEKYYDNYEYIENDDDISKTTPIGKIKLESKNKMIIEWIGLYNIKLKKLQFVNDFLLITENDGKTPITLEKCD